MKSILIIAKNTFKECVRDKILYSILGFALLFIISTIFLGSISLGEDLKIIRDFGLAGIYIFSIIITIFIGTSLVYKEIEKRTLFITLAKPVTRSKFILGKFVGLFLSVTLVTALMLTVYLIVVASRGGGFDWRGLVATTMLLPEIAVFIGLSILFSTFSTPLASTIYAIMVLAIGHSLESTLLYLKKIGGASYYIFQGLYYILPNLEKFNLRNLVVHDSPINSQGIVFALAYGFAYSILLLIVANWSLNKQEL